MNAAALTSTDPPMPALPGHLPCHPPRTQPLSYPSSADAAATVDARADSHLLLHPALQPGPSPPPSPTHALSVADCVGRLLVLAQGAAAGYHALLASLSAEPVAGTVAR